MSLRRSILATAAFISVSLAGCAPAMMPSFTEAVHGVTFQPVGFGDEAVKLAVHESGHGKPIILIHGLGASSYTWRKVIPELSKTNRVIAIDLKGFGESDKPLDTHYSIFDQARLIEDYMQQNRIHGATLVGHSYGGGVALAVAMAQINAPNRNIDRLVLIDSIAYRQPMPFFFQLLRVPVLGELGMTLVPPEIQMQRAMSIAYYRDDKVGKDAIDNYASALYSEGGRHALLYTINSLDPAQADALSKHYKDFKLPALLLWCDHDRIVPLSLGKRLSKDLPNARIKVIEDCGHIPHEEQPEATLRALKSFISG
jgi:pimeloyl-ACP methyl ester carboxylesterase